MMRRSYKALLNDLYDAINDYGTAQNRSTLPGTLERAAARVDSVMTRVEKKLERKPPAREE
jgi:hypothetical protein